MTEAVSPEACTPLARALLGWALCGRIGGASGPKDEAEKTRKMAEVVIHDVTVCARVGETTSVCAGDFRARAAPLRCRNAIR